MILASKGVIPPECWMNNIDDEDIRPEDAILHHKEKIREVYF